MGYSHDIMHNHYQYAGPTDLGITNFVMNNPVTNYLVKPVLGGVFYSSKWLLGQTIGRFSNDLHLTFAVPNSWKGVSSSAEFAAAYEQAYPDSQCRMHLLHVALPHALEMSRLQRRPLMVLCTSMALQPRKEFVSDVLHSEEVLSILREHFLVIGFERDTKEARELFENIEFNDLPSLAFLRQTPDKHHEIIKLTVCPVLFFDRAICFARTARA